jgi:large subunit ribosomal protein L4
MPLSWFQKRNNMAKTTVTKTKKTTVKTAATVKKAVAVKTVKAKVAKITEAPVVKAEKIAAKTPVAKVSLSANLVDVNGKSAGKLNLPPELFGATVEQTLIAQAVRVYLANQREGSAVAKTRGEVEGSTRKIYRQKGTGKARHGGIRAPIFVGGGAVFGPRLHDFHLKMPQKMRRLALFGALTNQYQLGNVIFVSGLNEIKPKTKIMAKTLATIGVTGSVMILTGKEETVIGRAGRNIKDTEVMPGTNLNPFHILAHHKLVITPAAVEAMKAVFIGK